MPEDQLQQQAIGWLAAVGHTPSREGAELENGSVRQNRFFIHVALHLYRKIDFLYT